ASPVAVAEPELAERLQRLAVPAVFLPAGELRRDGGRWSFRGDADPPKPLERVAVILVVRSSEALATLLSSPAGTNSEGAAHALSAGLAEALHAGGPYGKVAGVHLEGPFSAATAGRAAELLTALRKELPPGTLVSISLVATPGNDEERKRL